MPLVLESKVTMNGASPFGPREYTTIHFPLEDEEHLVPRDLISRSKKIQALIGKSHDNSFSLEIASSTFADLVHYLSGEPAPLEPGRIRLMMEAARDLEFIEAEKKLTELFWKETENLSGG